MQTELVPVAEIVLVIVFVLWRQLATRRVRQNLVAVPLVLGGLGVAQTAQLAAQVAVPPARWAGLVVTLACGALLAVPRARSLRLWQAADGTWWRRGTVATLGWWIVSFLTHGVVGVAAMSVAGARAGQDGFEPATMLVYLGVSLGVQALCLEHRLERLCPDSRIRRITEAAARATRRRSTRPVGPTMREYPRTLVQDTSSGSLRTGR